MTPSTQCDTSPDAHEPVEEPAEDPIGEAPRRKRVYRPRTAIAALVSGAEVHVGVTRKKRVYRRKSAVTLPSALVQHTDGVLDISAEVSLVPVSAESFYNTFPELMADESSDFVDMDP